MTKAAILAFLKHFGELIKEQDKERGPGEHGLARVVEGRDLDSDGVVDDVVFRE